MTKYRIRTVSQMTGLSPALIRAWEARYRLVVPERTPAGYRLYSDEDVALLQGAQRLVQRGIAPMEVAQLPRAQLKEASGAAVHEPPVTSSVIGSYSEHVERIVAAFARFNQAEAEGLLSRPLSMLPPLEACRQILVPLMRELGDRWHRGEISVAVEHFGTSLIRAKLVMLLETMRHRGGHKTVLCACPPGDLHEGGLLMFALEAAEQGWQPIYLGPDLPLAALTSATAQVQPSLAALSLVMRREPSELQRLLCSLHDAVAERCPVLLGGSGLAGHEELVLRTGCHLMPPSGRLDDLLSAGRERRSSDR
ncbi:MerR family transcriptional regulator [Haliangium sp. UPWRP_2]|uniref:MerR family transcriptional regulator n=1 Tax=Haliangium sp. UPWRP_2 TaxID=1931276 RepID=UPI000B54049E|nr:MerR family transcriptional regulator [Haliangium sp. UPWRP_2]PSM32477.1 MerR family DNA-binding transcriptional regulator [Haliangium sp. UPWRP_2]